MDTEVGRLAGRIDSVEAEVQNVKSKVETEFDPEVTVVASGVAFEAGEDIKQKATDIVSRGLSLPRVQVVNAIRFRGRGRRPGLVKMQFQSVDDKKQVLKAKPALKNEQSEYKGVYLRTSYSHSELVQQDNIRELLKIIPGGDQMYIAGNGKLMKKGQQGQRQPGAANNDETLGAVGNG